MSRNSYLEKRLYEMLENVNEVTTSMVNEHWVFHQDTRKERLAIAIANGEIGFQQRLKNTHQQPSPSTLVYFDSSQERRYNEQNYKRVEIVKKYVIDSGFSGYMEVALLNAKDLLKWLKRNYPLEDPTSEVLPFMSEELQIAFDCSKKLYPVAPKGSPVQNTKRYNHEKNRIEKELKDKNLDATTKKAMAKIINPEVKASHIKTK